MTADRTPVVGWAFARLAATLTALLGISVLLGWALDISALKRVLPGLVAMRPQTAANFVLCGAGLFVASLTDDRPAWSRLVLACALAIGLVGLLTVLEHALGVDVNMRRLLWSAPDVTVDPVVSRRMSLNAAVTFLLVALALGAKLNDTPRARMLSDGFAVGALLIALVALVGHINGLVNVLTGLAVYFRMPLHTATGFVVLSAGLVLAPPAGPVTTAMTGTGPGGILVRWLLPAFSTILLLVGWVSLVGGQRGYYDLHVALANMLVFGLAAFAAAVALTARVLQNTEMERRHADASRDASERRYRAIVESTFDGIVISENGTIVDGNAGLARMFGYELAELRGASILDLVAEESRTFVLERISSGEASTYEAVGIRRDGERIHIEAVARMEEGDNVRRRISAIRDVTQRKLLEAQLRQATKLEAVGRLAGGVAHDFNNLLTVISGHAELIRQDARPDDPMLDDVRQILHASSSAAALTRQLLAFSRKQAMEPTVLSLNATVCHAERFLSRLIGEGVSIRTALSDDLRTITADATLLEQVIVNLAVNARDAMPDGGTLTIETSNVELDAAYARDHGEVRPGPYVMLAMSDTGHGMDESTQRQIFEPFFTTKELGQGTGLGLATVYGIVKQSSGFIWVYSEVGTGTTFKIYFPSSDQPVQAERPTLPTASQPRGRETVLLAEDSDAVRSIASETLERNGYTVLVAPDASTAIRIAAEYPGQIHLLVSDVIMPGMSGQKLAEHFVGRRPDLRVLFISGYTSDALLPLGILRPRVHLLEKPFSPAGLAQKVRQVLDAPLVRDGATAA